MTSFPVPVRQIVIPHWRQVRGFGTAAYSPTIQAGQQAGVSIATTIGLLAGGPLGGAIAASVAEIGVMLSDLWSGCGQTCTEATALANQTEPLLQNNLNQYLSANPRWQSLQTAALANFDNTWASLTQACSNPALGSAGQACISDRQSGSCAYKTSPGGWDQVNGVWTYTRPGANGSGSACWNWFVGYRDPIANDPSVIPDPIPGGASLNSLVSSIGLNPSSTLFGLPMGDVLAIGAALLLAAVLL